MGILKSLFILCCAVVATGSTQPNCSLLTSPPVCTVHQGPPGRDGSDWTEGPAGPPGALGISTFDLKTISDQIKAEVLKEEVDSKLSQSKARKCHDLGRFSYLPATSCQEVYECNQEAPSGEYWINVTHGRAW